MSQTNHSGVLWIDKPLGLTSQQVVTRVKRLWNVAKAGHTGSLDPMATGLLPVCLGQATKYTRYLLDADKTYEVQAIWGVATHSGDMTGREVGRSHLPLLDHQTLQDHCTQHWIGSHEQVPPMVSALKHQGQPLHWYARRGETVERPPRAVVIHDFEILSVSPAGFRARVCCSKGTYIRTLVQDVAESLGVVACVRALRRTQVGDWSLAGACPLSSCQDALLQPTERLCSGYPVLGVTADELEVLYRGLRVRRDDLPEGAWYRLHDESGRFWGMVTIKNAEIKVMRLLARSASSARLGDN